MESGRKANPRPKTGQVVLPIAKVAGLESVPSRYPQVTAPETLRRARAATDRTMSSTTIARIRATTVTVPLEAPLQHATAPTGAALCARSSRSKPTTASLGWVRWAAAAKARRRRSRAALVPPRARLVSARGAALQDLQPDRQPLQQPHPAACGHRVRLPGLHRAEAGRSGLRRARRQGARRGRVRQLSFLSLHRIRETGEGEVRTPDQLVEHALALKTKHGFRSHKLKGGVYPPDYELACYRALAGGVAGDSFRYDPNARSR